MSVSKQGEVTERKGREGKRGYFFTCLCIYSYMYRGETYIFMHPHFEGVGEKSGGKEGGNKEERLKKRREERE